MHQLRARLYDFAIRQTPHPTLEWEKRSEFVENSEVIPAFVREIHYDGPTGTVWVKLRSSEQAQDPILAITFEYSIPSRRWQGSPRFPESITERISHATATRGTPGRIGSQARRTGSIWQSKGLCGTSPAHARFPGAYWPNRDPGPTRPGDSGTGSFPAGGPGRFDSRTGTPGNRARTSLGSAAF